MPPLGLDAHDPVAPAAVKVSQYEAPGALELPPTRHRPPVSLAAVARAPAPPASEPPATAERPAAGARPSLGEPAFDGMREIQEVASAEQLLASDPARALALVRSGEARPSGYLREERRYVGVVALFKLGRLEEARAEAASFLGDYPDGPYTARVRAMR